MIDQVAAAFEQKDYKTASKLIKQLLQESPSDPWVKLYVGKLQEVSGKNQDAEKIYRRLLRDETNSKIVAQARQGLQRLREFEEEERKRSISQAMANDNANEPGVLILEPINNELKTQAAPKFARIMQLDPYSARLLLPSRGWRLYRTGAIGELKFYGEQLQQVEIPCFWTTLAAIQKIQIFQVNYFQSSSSQVTVVCHNQNNQLGSITFAWHEIKARVFGLLPIFEEVVDRNARGKLERKTQTQDYAHFCDLHIPNRGCILRLFDGGYEFQKGIEITPSNTQNTVCINWNNLSKWLDQQIPQVKVWSDFTPFAETAIDQKEMLSHIQPHILLFRREASYWDSAFQLYSGLVYLKVKSYEL
ncbi:MAG: tetratricopeptide repeat protein [Calothrix sp. C42_A2020_038]|nr:tetratricopeptide repeat protein [Calothrix sp. C42_A2020_038]